MCHLKRTFFKVNPLKWHVSGRWELTRACVILTPRSSVLTPKIVEQSSRQKFRNLKKSKFLYFLNIWKLFSKFWYFFNFQKMWNFHKLSKIRRNILNNLRNFNIFLDIFTIFSNFHNYFEIFTIFFKFLQFFRIFTFFWNFYNFFEIFTFFWNFLTFLLWGAIKGYHFLN